MNPVLKKDLLLLLRLRRITAIQICFVALLAALVLIAWPQGGLLTISASRQDDLLLGIMLGQLIVLILAVPGVAAVSLTSELESNTLEMLYTSRLSAAQIVLGKVLSAIAFPLLLLLSGLPFTGLLVFRGAVDLDLLAVGYFVLLVTAILLAVLSLTVSSLCRQTGAALVTAYLLALTLCGGVLVPAGILLEVLGGPLATLVHGLRACSPIAAMLSLLRPGMPGDFDGSSKGNYPSHQIFFVIAAVLVVACVGLLMKRLARPPAESQAGSKDHSTKPRKPFGSGNPLLGKEARTSKLRSGTGLLRIVYTMLVLSLMLSLMSLSGGAEHSDLLRSVFQVIVSFQLIGIAAVVPSLTAPLISAEIETGTFEMLRLSRLSGRQIFWGKFLPAYTAALAPVLAVIPAYATVCLVNPAYIRYSLDVLPIMLLAMTFCCVLGFTCSVFTNASARATVLASMIVASLFALPALAWWAANAGLIHDDKLVGFLALPSPLIMALSVVPQSVDLSMPPTESTSAAGLLPMHEWLIGGLCAAMLILCRFRLRALLLKG